MGLNVGYETCPILESPWMWRVPPGNALTGAGFAKSVCKISTAKSSEVKILITKHLNPTPMFLTALLPPRQ